MNDKDFKTLKMNLQYFANEDETGKEEETDDDKEKNEGSEEKNKETKTNPSKEETKDDKEKLSEEEKNNLLEEGRKGLLKELGLNNDDESKKLMKFFKTFVDSQSNEKEENPEIEEANRKVLLAEAKVEALKNGVKSEFVDDIVTIALTKQKENQPLSEVIVSLKDKYDFFFGEDDNNPADKGTGSSAKHKKTGNEVEGIGARLAAKQKPNKTMNSYWK